MEVDNEASDGDLAGLTSAASSRAGSSAGLGLGNVPGRFASNRISPQPGSSQSAGFGVEKRSGTPESWVRRLADDGMSYYYVNKIDGQVQRTRPITENGIPSHQEVVRQTERRPTMASTSTSSSYTSLPLARDNLFSSSTRLRSDSATSQQPTASESSKRLSVYSDDSDIQPRESDKPARSLGSMTDSGVLPGQIVVGHRRKSRSGDIGEEEPFEMTPSERNAVQLQETLAPGEPESIDHLSERVREAIINVMHTVDDNGLPKGPDQDREVEDGVTEVVVAVRNLLYISCALSGPLPNNLGERNARDPTATAAAQQLQACLKTSQRKVTATLSKLVLSARAARFKRELLSADMMVRVEQDAADLQRAVDSFVVEVQKQYARTAIKQLHARVGRKRLRGVFGLSNLGLSLPGAGVAGCWKGLGYVGFEEDGNPPKRTLSVEVLSEAKACSAVVEEKLSVLSASLDTIEGGESKLAP